MEVEEKKAIDNSAPMTEEEKKKARIQEQLNKIRRMKQAKQSSSGSASGSPGLKSNKSITSRLRLVQNVAERTIKRYNEEARGPEKWDILRTYPTPTIFY